jgi:hypothetical protein
VGVWKALVGGVVAVPPNNIKGAAKEEPTMSHEIIIKNQINGNIDHIVDTL